ncbi:hypothetical protein ScPMuIL_014577 [Solemya velum]
MDAQIEEAIPALIAAVETIMNPLASQQDRLSAHQLSDNFKESSSVCTQCGLILSRLHYSPIIRHFGLQLLEHSIKFRWNSLSVQDKQFLKKSCLDLIGSGTKGILEEYTHVKDAVSRVAVEIIKREWPQMWTSMLNDLYEVCNKGETQTELVLKIFLRLVEDVVQFQNVPTQRRREIMQALTSHMTELFDFFLSLLQKYSTNASVNPSSANTGDALVSLAHCRVSEAVLETLNGYLDWVNMTLIFMRDGLLLQVLCLLLSMESLQLHAAECLLIIVSRKGKLEERKPLLILFSEDAMSVIWNAAVAAEQSSQDEYYYLFLKRLCQVLTEIGKQLCALWGSVEDVGQPPNFSKYLEALLAFTSIRVRCSAIFSAVIFNIPGQTKGTRSRAVKNVRQHACSVLVKICKQYPELLFPVFDQLYTHIQMISRDPEQLSQMEKCILTEALILISNQFHDFEKQSTFVEEVLRSVKELWLSAEFKEAFWSPEKFMSYVGLDQPPVEPSSADTCGINRSHITYCINTILAVMKRTKWPDDPQTALKGSFVFGNHENGSPILRNPATAHISVLLENVFALQKTLNATWLPEYLKLRHPDFSKAYDLLEVEKLAVLGIPPPCVDNSSSPACKQPLERMQHFLTVTHDMSCHILGNAGQCLGYEFYTAPNLSQSIMDSVLTNLDSLPDYRLRPIIRVFMKPYIQNCPKECFSQALIPVVNFVCQCVLQRLCSKWQVINQRQQNSFDNEEDNAESQEVLEDQLTRQLTREYIEMLGSLCYSRKSDMLNDDRMIEDSEMSMIQNKEDTLSELGQLCLKTESLYPSIVMCAFSGLSWNDTTTCNKCINLCWPLLKQLHADGKLTGEAANHFLCAILLGLQLHGQHEGCLAMLLSLGLQAYELLRSQFPDVMNIFLQIPNCTREAIMSFDKMIQGGTSPQKQLSEKKKKDAFKKLVSEIIGKNIGQQFKREVHYKNLPPMFKMKQKPPSLDEIETKDIGLCDLFKPPNGS